MARFEDLCLGCMKDKNGETICPLCGFKEQPVKLPYLPIRTVLAGKYVIGKMLSINGEGVTYIGYDKVLGSPVTIREYLPTNLATRETGNLDVKILPGNEVPYEECKEEFLRLSRIRARLRNIESIISVYDIFEGNNTAYTISEYVQGMKFSDYLKKRGGILEWKEVRMEFLPLLNALSQLHAAGVTHLAINPEHILVDRENKLILTGFSIDKVNIVHTDLTSSKFPGYTTLEQYTSDIAKGTWSDVYSIAAVMLTALTGVVPQEAPKRINDEKILTPAVYAERIPTNVLSAIIKALKPHPETRTRTIDQFKNEVTASFSMSGILNEIEEEKTSPVKKPVQKATKKENKVTLPKWAVTAGAIIIGVLIIVLLLVASNGSNNKNDDFHLNSSVSEVDDGTKTVSVPDFTREMYDDIKDDESYEFTVELIGAMFDDSAPEGKIVWQEPTSKEKVRPGDTVKIMISLGKRIRKVPNLEGVLADMAEIELIKSGFRVKREKKASTKVEFGEIVDTSPEAGSTIEYGSEIIIYVNDNDSKDNDFSIAPPPPPPSSVAPPPPSSAASSTPSSQESTPPSSAASSTPSSQESTPPPNSEADPSSITSTVSEEHTDIPPDGMG